MTVYILLALLVTGPNNSTTNVDIGTAVFKTEAACQKQRAIVEKEKRDTKDLKALAVDCLPREIEK